jgi:hypothetical protein
LIELHKRFAYPAACLVLMLVGVPLGVTSRRGGKSSAWVFTILLVILYYSLSLVGIAMGRQNWIPTFLAVWSANILFAAGGIFCCGRWPAAARCSAPSPRGPRARQSPSRAPAKPAGASSAGIVTRFQAGSIRAEERSVAWRVSPHP